nr:uncharacterized protein LOC109155364 [Ipomoea batatas]
MATSGNSLRDSHRAVCRYTNLSHSSTLKIRRLSSCLGRLPEPMGFGQAGTKRHTEGTRKSKRHAKKSKQQEENVETENSPFDNFVETTKNQRQAFLQRLQSQPDWNSEDKGSNQDSQSDAETQTQTVVMTYSAPYPSLSSRTMPFQLTQVLKKLNDAQRGALREIGFDHIDEQHISKIPGKLGWWLLTNFDARSCRLRIQDDEHVELLDDWMKELGRDSLNITPAQLCTAMVECTDGGDWFKRHLAILISTMLVESLPSGYVNTSLLRNFQDVTKIKDLNWCEYVLKTLVKTKSSTYSRTIPRQLPAFRGWITRLLNQRTKSEIKSGGFGYGYIDVPLEVPQPIEENNDDTEEGLQKFAEKIKLLGTTMLEVVGMAQEAPRRTLENEKCKQMLESTQKLLGISKVAGPEIRLTQQNDDFWNNPDNIVALEKIECAIFSRDQSKTKVIEAPKFSLGLTPDEMEATMENVTEILSHYTEKHAPKTVNFYSPLQGCTPMRTAA